MKSLNRIIREDEEKVFKEHLMDKGYHSFANMLYGSQNYELQTEESDIDSKFMVIPPVKDVILGHKKLSTEYDVGHGICLTQDYRVMFNSYYKGNINFVETLYTQYYTYNVAFEEEFFDLLNHADLIANADPARLIKMACGMAKQKYASMTHLFAGKQEVLAKYGYDPKQLHHLVRLNYFARDYIEHLDFRHALVPEPALRDDLTLLKVKPVSYEMAQKIADAHLEELISQVDYMERHKADFPDRKDDVKQFLEDLTVRIFNKSLALQRSKGVEK